MSTKSILHILIISLISVSIFLTYLDKDGIKNNKAQSDNLGQVAKQLIVLMKQITMNIRTPDLTEDRIRQNGYTYLSYYYNNPTENEVNTVIGNINQDPSWHIVPKRVEDDKNIFLSYCYGKLGMNLSKYIFKESVNAEGIPRLRINIFYYEDSDCNK